jgi:hypothetical protein
MDLPEPSGPRLLLPRPAKPPKPPALSPDGTFRELIVVGNDEEFLRLNIVQVLRLSKQGEKKQDEID